MFGPWTTGNWPAPLCSTNLALFGSMSVGTMFVSPDVAASRMDWLWVKFFWPVSFANSPPDGYPGCFGSIDGFARASVIRTPFVEHTTIASTEGNLDP